MQKASQKEKVKARKAKVPQEKAKEKVNMVEAKAEVEAGNPGSVVAGAVEEEEVDLAKVKVKEKESGQVSGVKEKVRARKARAKENGEIEAVLLEEIRYQRQLVIMPKCAGSTALVDAKKEQIVYLNMGNCRKVKRRSATATQRRRRSNKESSQSPNPLEVRKRSPDQSPLVRRRKEQQRLKEKKNGK